MAPEEESSLLRQRDGMMRHNCVMSYLNRRQCASGPGAEISVSCNDRAGAGRSVTSVITQNAGLLATSNHPPSPRPAGKQEFRIISEKRVIESFIEAELGFIQGKGGLSFGLLE